MEKASIGLVGLAVMGENLARNIQRNGFSSAVFNRTYSKTEEFLAESKSKGQTFLGASTLQEFVERLERPRRIILMVKAGSPVDDLMVQLLPLLEPGDILMDGGNAHFEDTIRREKLCRDKGIYFLGVGISGGEEGALNGASIMPGGAKEAWEKVSDLFEKIAADAGRPCTTYIGPDGSGHFVKMVHNGIEYADMQLIAESYDLLRHAADKKPDQLSKIFESWNQGVLNSFLIEITAKIFTVRDPEEDGWLVDVIVDSAGQKGTGRWTVQIALDLGVAIPTISAAVDARVLSAMKKERTHAAAEFAAPLGHLDSGHLSSGPLASPAIDSLVDVIHDALYASKIISYAQGMALLSAASEQRSWELKLGEIASIWRGGCIIRARFLDAIASAYAEQPHLTNLLLADSMKEEISRTLPALRQAVGIAARLGIPIPALASSLSYFDSYRTAKLPQNLTQAQRDFFGAHTYQRFDRTGDFHTEWEKLSR